MKDEDLVNVSDLNQYLYCPRRYWYLNFYDTQGRNYYRIDGKLRHEGKSERGGWTREMFLKSSELGLKGKIDVIEDTGGRLLPIERKRGDQYFYNDEVQLAAYALLLESATGSNVREGVIYLYETDQRIYLNIEPYHREKVREIVEEMREMTVDNVPPFTDNPNKCVKCSTRGYCMPEESKLLGEA